MVTRTAEDERKKRASVTSKVEGHLAIGVWAAVAGVRRSLITLHHRDRDLARTREAANGLQTRK
jgi:hypothetical protein